MQIIIAQAEIEQAIINYIHSQINVKDGMSISVDLKATRGDQGTTAIIDIVPTTEVAAPTAVVEAEPVVETPIRRTRQPAAVAVTPVTKPADKPVEASVKEEEVIDTSPSSPLAEETADENPAEEAAEEEPPAAKPQSLFANLKNPRNG